MPATETEAGFTRAVLDLAALHGWRRYHPLPLRTARGWATGTQGEVGYPDLTLARAGRVIFAELKVGRGRTTPAQDEWLAALRACPGVEVYEWRPAAWDAIVATLAGDRAAAARHGGG